MKVLNYSVLISLMFVGGFITLVVWEALQALITSLKELLDEKKDKLITEHIVNTGRMYDSAYPASRVPTFCRKNDGREGTCRRTTYTPDPATGLDVEKW
jgi:hypothetical protein